MKLLEFEYEKFRSANEKIVLPIHDITILIGQNGGGKTSTLDALQLFFDPSNKIKEEDINSAIDSENLEVIFTGKFHIDEQEKEFFQNYKDDISTNCVKINKKFRLDNGETYYYLNAIGTGTELDNLDLGRFKDPYITLCKKFGIDQSHETVAQLKEKLEEKRDELPKDKNVEKIIPKNEISKYLPLFLLLSSEEAPDPKREMIKILTNTLKDKVEELNIEKEVDRITSVIMTICNKKIEEANELIKRYCNDIETIDVNPEYDALQGLKLNEFNIIKKKGDRVRFESEATGKRKQIMLGIYEWSNLQITEELNKDFIIAFDEPDLHFDYFQISNLLNILKDFSRKENVQVLIATHSIKLIDNFPPNQILNFNLNQNDETEVLFITDEDFEQIGDFLRDISFSIGFRSVFLFFEKIFVIVEGESEFRALPIFFELLNKKTHFEAGISLINAEDNIQALKLAQFLKRNGKKVIIIVDKDSKKRKEFKEEGLRKMGFSIGTDFMFVGKESDSEGELEGEFTSEQWVNILNDKFPKKNNLKWKTKDIDDIRNKGKISDKLINKIQAECIENITKPDLIREMAKSITNENDLSENLKEILNKLNSIANSI